METPSQLPSRPRELVDLLSDDEEGDDAAGLAPPLRPGYFREVDEFDDGLLGNLMRRESQAAWEVAELDTLMGPVPIRGGWRNEVPQPVPEAILPQGSAPDLPQRFRQAERLNIDPRQVNLIHNQANNDQPYNDNDFIQQEVNNQLNNDLLGLNDLVRAELNNQLRNDQMDNDGNFVWEQVNREQHNANNTIDRDPPPTAEMVNKANCLEGVVDIFPDICLDYIDQLYTTLQGRKTIPAIVELVLHGEENGEPYPKINQLKRKRPVQSDDDDEAIMRKYTADRQHNSDKYLTLA